MSNNYEISLSLRFNKEETAMSNHLYQDKTVTYRMLYLEIVY